MKEREIPHLFWRILKWLCPEELFEGIEGDLFEKFEDDIAHGGLKYARRQYRWSVIRFIRPGILLRNHISISPIHWGILVNFSKVACRSMLRYPTYTVVNLTGLTLALAVAITLFLTARFELSFDTHHANSDRLYQVTMMDKYGDPGSHVPQAVVKALREQFPGVEYAASVIRMDPQVIAVDEKRLGQKNTFFMHPEFLRMIDVKWISGSIETSLLKPYQVVLERNTARNLFGDGNPIGRVIRYDNAMDLVVSGIIDTMPENSEFQFSMIMSHETLKQYEGQYSNDDNWGGGDSWFHGYVLFHKEVDKELVRQQIARMINQHKDQTNYETLAFVPFSKMHFETEIDQFNYTTSIWTIRAFSGIAAFLIIIAAINFINLATAQATTRSREIGVRKAIGSGSIAVMLQFFMETGVLVVCAVIAGSGISVMLLPYVDYFFNTQAAISEAWDIEFIIGLISLAALITILAGSYPALLLSRFKPANILKGQSLLISSRSGAIRKSLVVVQFVIAQVLVICMILTMEQMKLFYETDLGFEKEHIITVTMPYRDSILLQEQFRQQLLGHPAIKDVSFALTSPSSIRNWWWGDVTYSGLLDSKEYFRLQWIDHNYLDFYNIQLIAGRGFDQTDTSAYAIVNESALKSMGFSDPEKVLGESVSYWGNSNKVTIIGVVEDYYSQGLKSKVPPHLYMYGKWNFQQAQIKVDSAGVSDALAVIQRRWTELHPNHYFAYEFLSDSLQEFYHDEKKMANAITAFSVVGISIGCLGLFGLVSFVCVRRNREVSIRKVFGATISNIIVLLTREFIGLVLVALTIAIPLGWYLMEQVLDNYANRISIHWTVFLIAGTTTLLLAVTTVFIKSFGTARMNPAESIRQE